MKNIFFIFLLLVSNCVTAQEYKGLFAEIDSISQTSPSVYLGRILSMLNYEYNHSTFKKTDKSKDIIITLKTTEEKKLKIVYIDSKNLELEEAINQWLTKTPPIPIDKFKDLPTEFNFVSLKFVLKTIDYKGLTFDELIELKNSKDENSNSLNEIDIYPSYGKKKDKYSNKEKASKNLDKFISDFIKKEFKYPDYAAENNIQGKTIINFIINKEGDVKTIYSYCSHPILQLQGIDIIKKLPKFNPGFQNGKPVNVRYALPLTFKLK